MTSSAPANFDVRSGFARGDASALPQSAMQVKVGRHVFERFDRVIRGHERCCTGSVRPRSHLRDVIAKPVFAVTRSTFAYQ